MFPIVQIFLRQNIGELHDFERLAKGQLIGEGMHKRLDSELAYPSGLVEEQLAAEQHLVAELVALAMVAPADQLQRQAAQSGPRHQRPPTPLRRPVRGDARENQGQRALPFGSALSAPLPVELSQGGPHLLDVLGTHLEESFWHYEDLLRWVVF